MTVSGVRVQLGRAAARRAGPLDRRVAGTGHPRRHRAARGDQLRGRAARARTLRRRGHRRRVPRGPRRGARAGAAVLHDRGRARAAGRARRAVPPRAGWRPTPTTCSSPPAPSRRFPCSPPPWSSPATPCSSRAPATWRHFRSSASPARGWWPCRATDTAIDPDALDELVARERPKLLYTVPTFQNPTGPHPAGRAARRRRRGRRPARAVDRRGRPVRRAALRGRARAVDRVVPGRRGPYRPARVLLQGAWRPGMRLGWLRAPAELRRACAVAKQAADLHTPTVNQLAAARYLADRDLDAHVTRVAARLPRAA